MATKTLNECVDRSLWNASREIYKPLNEYMIIEAKCQKKEDVDVGESDDEMSMASIIMACIVPSVGDRVCPS